MGAQHKCSVRERCERVLSRRYGEKVAPFSPKEHAPLVEQYKDGTFGTSSCAFALYSHGYGCRASSTNDPFGYIYHDGHVFFSIGMFVRREDRTNYLFIVSPKGTNMEREVDSFAKDALDAFREEGLEVGGAYVRFLSFPSYLWLLNLGFLPAKARPWHPDAPEEDEHLPCSAVRLDELFDGPSGILLSEPRGWWNRFSNFLSSPRNNGLRFSLEPAHAGLVPDMRKIITSHFKSLEMRQKAIGSSYTDYVAITDSVLWEVPGVLPYAGFLEAQGGRVPASFFLAEPVAEKIAALYASISLRGLSNQNGSAPLYETLSSLGASNYQGASSFPSYALLSFLHVLRRDHGFETVLLGGSEHPDLNQHKRQMGAEIDPTYWAFLPAQNP